MAITKVNAVGGTAEILGQVLPFRFEGGSLTIDGVGYGDVTRILDQLAAGIMWDERPPAAAKEMGVAATFPEVGKKVVMLDATTMTEKTVPAEAPKAPSARGGELPLGDSATVKNGGGSPEPALISADSLMKVLTILKSKGFSEWKPLLDECERIRPEVPVLKKLNDADFKDRILRVAASKLQMAVPDDA